MNFKGHFTGGLIVGAIASTVSFATIHIQHEEFTVFSLLSNPFKDHPLQTPFFVFLTAWFMALFPDLDTASIIQRWFYRVILIVLFLLMLNKQSEYFIILSFIGVFPLIDKHRGWTHWKSAPIMITLFLAIVFEYIRAKDAILPIVKTSNIIGFIKHYSIYIVAAILGHQTHLFLDKPKAKKLFFTRWMNK